MKVEEKTEEQALEITREFKAPRELVWKAWTDPEVLMKWWGPADFTSPGCRMDLRVGGKYLWCMRSPDGKDFWTTGTFREIAPPSLLVMTNSFSDENGNIVPSTYYGMSPEIALEMVVTVRLQEIENGTKMILSHSGLSKMSSKEQRDTDQGWNESFDKMAAAICGKDFAMQKSKPHTIFIAEPGVQDVMITREFDAPRELVFRAFTDPSMYIKWLGPKGYSMKLEKFEPRSGGSWRYVHKDPSGNEFGFHGVYHEVLPPQRLIDTFEFEGMPESGHVSLETATFEPLPGGRTKLTIHSVFLSVADRDGMAGGGMERGLNESFERLTDLLSEMQAAAAGKK